jgi:hypothetical protein
MFVGGAVALFVVSVRSLLTLTLFDRLWRCPCAGICRLCLQSEWIQSTTSRLCLQSKWFNPQHKVDVAGVLAAHVYHCRMSAPKAHAHTKPQVFGALFLGDGLAVRAAPRIVNLSCVYSCNTMLA